MTDETDEALGPWTIKSVPPAVRKRVVACAKKRSETVAVWLARAVTAQADLEDGAVVSPPTAVPMPSPILPRSHLSEVADMLRAAVAVSEASGVRLPERTARHAFEVLDNELQAVRGLPRGRL